MRDVQCFDQSLESKLEPNGLCTVAMLYVTQQHIVTLKIRCIVPGHSGVAMNAFLNAVQAGEDKKVELILSTHPGIPKSILLHYCFYQT